MSAYRVPTLLKLHHQSHFTALGSTVFVDEIRRWFVFVNRSNPSITRAYMSAEDVPKRPFVQCATSMHLAWVLERAEGPFCEHSDCAENEELALVCGARLLAEKLLEQRLAGQPLTQY